MSKHYIIKVKSPHGEQYAHIETEDESTLKSHPSFQYVSTGPHVDANTAWQEHHKRVTFPIGPFVVQ
jgi:hypothetical protein